MKFEMKTGTWLFLSEEIMWWWILVDEGVVPDALVLSVCSG